MSPHIKTFLEQTYNIQQKNTHKITKNQTENFYKEKT